MPITPIGIMIGVVFIILNGPQKKQERYFNPYPGEGPDEDADRVQILNNKVQDLQTHLGTQDIIKSSSKKPQIKIEPAKTR